LLSSPIRYQPKITSSKRSCNVFLFKLRSSGEI